MIYTQFTFRAASFERFGHNEWHAEYDWFQWIRLRLQRYERLEHEKGGIWRLPGSGGRGEVRTLRIQENDVVEEGRTKFTSFLLWG